MMAVSIGLAGSGRACADDIRPPKSTAATDEIDRLVIELGDDLFSVRENATNQLLQKGIAAKPRLVKATKSSDAEVRMRAKRVLASVAETDFKTRLKAFTADSDGSRQTTLPGWSEFKKLLGATPPARELFVEMQTAEPALMEAFEQGPKEAELVLKQRSLPAVDQVQVLGRRGPMRTNTGSLGSTLALLFVAGQPELPVGDDVATRIATLPKNQSFRDATTTSDTSPRRALCLKVLGQWVGREVSADSVDQNLAYAYYFNLREGLTPSINILQQPQSANTSKLLAMLVACKFGSEEQLSAIAPYLTDHHVCQDFGAMNTPMQVQLCDVALLVTIKLSGQDPKKFGFPRSDIGESSLPNFHTMAFASEDERKAAFKKWEDWQKAQKSGPTEQTAKKSSREKAQ
jgi:hypothetical protein